MTTIMLRVTGLRFDVEAFLRSHRRIEPDQVWCRGDVVARRKMTGSGFNMLVAEADDADDALNHLARFLKRSQRLFRDLTESGASSELDIALYVGFGKDYTASATFPPEVLERIARFGIVLRVSGYPTTPE